MTSSLNWIEFTWPKFKSENFRNIENETSHLEDGQCISTSTRDRNASFLCMFMIILTVNICSQCAFRYGDKCVKLIQYVFVNHKIRTAVHIHFHILKIRTSLQVSATYGFWCFSIVQLSLLIIGQSNSLLLLIFNTLGDSVQCFYDILN